MQEAISKELLNNVLGTKYEGEVVIVDDNIKYGHYIINKYKFANECKLWAYRLDEYEIASGRCYSEVFGRHSSSDDDPLEGFSGDTEIEAIFKACEWILERTR